MIIEFNTNLNILFLIFFHIIFNIFLWNKLIEYNTNLNNLFLK